MAHYLKEHKDDDYNENEQEGVEEQVVKKKEDRRKLECLVKV